jgi:hypothetical protein
MHQFQVGKSGFDTVFTDGSPGAFDQHGRLRRTNSLESLFPSAWSADKSYAATSGRSASSELKFHVDSQSGDVAQYESERLAALPKSEWSNWANRHVSLPHEVTVTPDARVLIRRFRIGNARLFAFERNIEYKMSEDLKQAGGNENLEKPIVLEATLASTAFVYDLEKQQFLADTNRVHFKLDSWKPTILALLTNKVSDSELLARLAQQ